MTDQGRSHCGNLRPSDIGCELQMNGWVDALRDHGEVLFIHLRDRSGIVQVVFSPEFASSQICKRAAKLRKEFCISVCGRVVKRGKGTENPYLETGQIEVMATDLSILSKAKRLPFQISEKAMIVGVRTYGKAVFEKTFKLNHDYRVKFITGAMYSPKGTSWQSKGLVPDFLVEQDAKTLEALFKMTPQERFRKDVAMITAFKLLNR